MMQGGAPMQQAPPQGAFGFSAKPQLINRPGPNSGPYGNQQRDPYREYVKVAPQNIMYDRRVVRGNTFAALVIPVNMQPDPTSVEKQKKAAAARRNRLQKMKEQKQQQQMMQQQMDGAKDGQYDDQFSQQQQQQQMQEMYAQQQQMQQMQQPMHDWIELDDRYNMIDEAQIEPDYYIDRPPSATYIPDEEGTDESIQVQNVDPDLFDYNLEVEPILQVLVGKSLEQARIEVIEQHELAALANSNRRYKQSREAMLVQTQRVEARQSRRNDETDRRNLQQRINQVLADGKEKREIARTVSKQFLKFFKRDTLQTLTDMGVLRNRKAFSMGSSFVPALYQQVKVEMLESEDRSKLIEETVQIGLMNRAASHKRAIRAEMQRREDLQNEKLREEADAKRAKERRRERRMCLKEQKRIQELSELLMITVVPATEQKEYTVAVPVYDVRDEFNAASPAGIYTFGGFIGELMMTLSSLNEHMGKLEGSVFEMKSDGIMKFLEEALVEGYPQGICFLRVAKDPLTEAEIAEETLEKQASLAASRLLKIGATLGYGMKFLLSAASKAGLNMQIVEDVLKAICQIHYYKNQESVSVPEDDAEVNDETRDKLAEQNDEIEKANELHTKLKLYVKLVPPPAPEENEEAAGENGESVEDPTTVEKCLVRIQNYREPVLPDVSADPALGANVSTISKDHHQSKMSAANPVDAEKDSKMETLSDTSSVRASKQIEAFEVEKLSQKLIMLRPVHEAFEGNCMVQHSEAVFMVRKHILEKAKNYWKEAKEVATNHVLGMTSLKQKQLDSKFEEHCIQELGYELGEQFEDQNMRVTFKTFLKQDDARLEE